VRNGSTPLVPYTSKSPRISPLTGSTNRARLCDSAESAVLNITRVVVPGPDAGRTADRVAVSPTCA